MKKTVSIIVPIYNCEDYLPRCIESVLNQSYGNFELILVDDGSVDGSRQICDEYENADNRIKVIHKANGGVSAARNTGLDTARGEYIAFIDADDYIPGDYLDVLCSGMTDDVDMVVCEADAYLPNGEGNPWRKSVKSTVVLEHFDVANFNEEYRHFWVWGVLFRASVISDLRFNTNYYVGEDTLFYYSTLKRCRKIRHTNATSYCYVLYPGSACHSAFSLKRYTEIYVWLDICKLYEDTPEIKEILLQGYVLRCHRMLDLIRESDTSNIGDAQFLKHEIRCFLPQGLKLQGYGTGVYREFILDAFMPEGIYVCAKRLKSRLKTLAKKLLKRK